MRTGSLKLLAALVAVLIGAGTLAAGARAAYPVVYSFPAGVAAAVADPAGSPPGANDFGCRPTAAHPRPVVLVHGTFENRRNNWNALSPLLANHGYCVFALNYGQRPPGNPVGATEHVAASAQELSAFVDRVLAATGTSQVDIVGHSQGGMMPRYSMRFLGDAGKVHALVGLVPSNHGTTAGGLARLAAAIPGGDAAIAAGCPACTDQFTGSAFLTRLNAGGDTEPGVQYTVITTRNDEVVTPYSSAFLSGADVTNIVVQRQCALDQVEHIAIPYDHIALRDVLNALDPSTARAPTCSPVLPLLGG
jgi:triacylglycerol esterase/lipase EstA (alpha/beta hydrolase family)